MADGTMKDFADITILFKNIEDVTFDVLIEFLEDQDIEYEIVKSENQRTSGDDEPDAYDIWHDRKMCDE